MSKALWIWRDLEQPEDFHLTADLIASIRTLAAGWNPLENGAAGLIFPGEVEAGEVDEDDDLAKACDIFLALADPGDWQGTLTNPYREAAYKEAAEEGDFQYAPDEAALAQFASGEDVEFTAAPFEIAAWAKADLRCHGIDPKRPFGSRNVVRDLTPIVDPDGALAKAELKKRANHVQSRMVLLLQYLVQHGVIEPGLYGAGEYGQWELRRSEGGPEGSATGEMLDHDEWVSRIYKSYYWQTFDYITCCEHLAFLVWDNRASGDYASLMQQFRLDSFYQDDVRKRYDGPTIDQVKAAVRHFPQVFEEGSNVFHSLAAIRARNSRAEYKEALALLAPSGWENFSLDFAKIIEQPDRGSLLLLEALIAQRGLDIISADQFGQIISGMEETWKGRFGGNCWELVWKLTKEAYEFDDPEFPVPFFFSKAAAFQILLMRGGFVPDEPLYE